METTNQIQPNGIRSKRRLRRSEEMYPLVESWLASNQSQKAFCEDQGIKMHLLSYWARRYEREKKGLSNQASPAMIPLQIKPGSSSMSGCAIEIIYPNGIKLRFSGMLEVGTLQALVVLEK